MRLHKAIEAAVGSLIAMLAAGKVEAPDLL
jgi:hypothetical protein